MTPFEEMANASELWVHNAPVGTTRSLQVGCDSDGVWAAQFWQVPDEEDPGSKHEVFEVAMSEEVARRKAYAAALTRWGA